MSDRTIQQLCSDPIFYEPPRCYMEEIIIGEQGYQGRKFYYKGSGYEIYGEPDELEFTDYIIQYSDNVYIIREHVGFKEFIGGEVFNQILFTFRFSEKKE